MHDNSLDGSIPQELGRLTKLQILHLSGNSFNVEIPQNLTDCLQLKLLSLYGNKLVGNIPLDIGSLSKLYWLSLANINNLIGHIPPSLGNLSLLTNLYLHDNSLDGSIPQELGRLTKLQILRLNSNSFNGEIPQNLTQCLQLRFLNLYSNKLVGKILSDIGYLSKLYNNLTGHITPLLGNLSLLTSLYLGENNLDGRIPKELGYVAIDIACALDYLHDHCPTTILHCDLKPSNVLLDDDMVAHIGDFGLARILSDDINDSRTQSNSLAIRGSIGYVAPEYGMGANPSTYGDVYSYGILLLEMLTGKRPSDDMFKNNLNLHQFAKMALPERVMEIIDR
ncbi:hypothetical protein MRB53_013931 [Persea americana]|uniref:Uncharacterized protein n=1 Tax=Persea americana TaxID=3435 RepID=A0ACC2K9F0_PERAE|nr:hypothetical protein MRB53_013931 [Persea americana]